MCVGNSMAKTWQDSAFRCVNADADTAIDNHFMVVLSIVSATGTAMPTRWLQGTGRAHAGLAFGELRCIWYQQACCLITRFVCILEPAPCRHHRKGAVYMGVASAQEVRTWGMPACCQRS